jgi:hypothetical protein
MKFELKEKQGIFFKNSYKVEGDNKPDYKGTIKIAGIEYELGIWKAKSGKAYNIKATEKNTQTEKRQFYKYKSDEISETINTEDLPF